MVIKESSMPDGAAKTLDTKGDLCPMPVVKAAKAIKEVSVGQVLEIFATDPASKPDFEAWSRMTGHKLLSTSEEAGPPKVYRFMIQRLR
jgi:TusA-related sulfurtransferase